ncbi:MAG: Ig-like domain-containing protein, partial [Planctomycetota bacterium]
YTHDGSATTVDSFTYQVSDDGGLPSNEATVNLTISGGGGLVTTGLVTHFATDAGVTVNGDLVTAWADQSGLDNGLASAGDPRRILGGLNGYPIIRFDGAGDKLERVGGILGLPTGDADRTVYIVANYRSGGYGGVAYGRTACNQAFGAVAAASGNYMVQGYCTQNDFDSGVPAVGAGWAVQSVVHQAGQFTHYLNGTVLDTAVHSFNTVVDEIVVGAELNDRAFLDMDVAEVLIYERALSSAELQQVDAYFQAKYFGGGGGNQPPVANDDGASVVQGDAVEIDVLGNDVDPDGTLDASTVLVVSGPANGVTNVNTTTGEITYTHDGSATTVGRWQSTAGGE